MSVITRFAPSPTGFLHIGSARTALFNYLFAKHMGGKYLLRIEDTDRARSTEEAVKAIFDGLNWLGLMSDEEPVFQFARAGRHAEVAHEMVRLGHAYRCVCSAAELDTARELARLENKPFKYSGKCRDRHLTDDESAKAVVRLKAPVTGATEVQDLVQGKVVVQNDQLDDMILLRADGTPTYMLSVVVDDHDMGITHVIRGDDHLTNTFRQIQIYQAMGWSIPAFAHIPLIHGPDGAKLSKRHGALGVDAYRDMGLLPEALCNYLTRLGWSHGDDEIFDRAQAIEWFTLDAVGKSPSRLDFAKLMHTNSQYLKLKTADELIELLSYTDALPHIKSRLMIALDDLKVRAKNLNELREMAIIFGDVRPLSYEVPFEQEAVDRLISFAHDVQNITWDKESIELSLKEFCEKNNLKMNQLGPLLRVALTGKMQAPSLGILLFALGKDESLLRLRDVNLV